MTRGHKIATSLLSGLSLIAFCLDALGQEARTPDELATQVAYAISSGDERRLASLVDHSIDPAALRVLLDRLMKFRGAEGFKVTAIGAWNDPAWWGGWRRSFGVDEFAQSWAERVVFPVEPLGRITVSQAPANIPFRCALGVLYGQFGQRYLLILARNREDKPQPKNPGRCLQTGIPEGK